MDPNYWHDKHYTSDVSHVKHYDSEAHELPLRRPTSKKIIPGMIDRDTIFEEDKLRPTSELLPAAPLYVSGPAEPQSDAAANNNPISLGEPFKMRGKRRVKAKKKRLPPPREGRTIWSNSDDEVQPANEGEPDEGLNLDPESEEILMMI